jgi:hypothetical protein
MSVGGNGQGPDSWIQSFPQRHRDCKAWCVLVAQPIHRSSYRDDEHLRSAQDRGINTNCRGNALLVPSSTSNGSKHEMRLPRSRSPHLFDKEGDRIGIVSCEKAPGTLTSLPSRPANLRASAFYQSSYSTSPSNTLLRRLTQQPHSGVLDRPIRRILGSRS